jgi:3-hydroxyisobutyrate dehydrogenase
MTRLGFAGLGRMGEPMAANLVRAGVPLTVWNRTDEKAGRLERLGATPVATVDDLFARCDTVVLMLANGPAIDEVLGRDGPRIAVPVAGRTVVNMGTVSPAYSRRLHDDLATSGARYVEAPVSGSRVPAEAGELVAMLAGDPDALGSVEELVAPMCAATFRCGDVPRALETKLAVNVFLISMVVGLAEAVRFAEEVRVDLGTLVEILDAGPMASAVSRIKLAKLLTGDHAPQASIRDVHHNSRLILEAAAGTGATMPLLTECAALLGEAEEQGLGAADMVAVLEAIRQRDRRRDA